MGLLSGPVSVTRFNVAPFSVEPDFEAERFVEIQPGSEVRERVGFVPMEPEAPYEVGQNRFAFRVRIDKLRPDPTAVQERVKQLVRVELDDGAAFVNAQKRKELRQLAEEELIVKTTPSSTILECCLDGGTTSGPLRGHLLHVASTAKSHLGKVIAQLRKIGIVADHKAPWIDRGDPEVESDIVAAYEPGQSVLGCRFLKALMGDSEIMFEGEAGHVQLQTAETKITLQGAVSTDLHRYVQRGAEILSAKLLTGGASFRLDALSFRLHSLRIEIGSHEHWTDLLDERLEKITAVWDLLDGKYKELAGQLG